jgi:hypothetical protein
MQPIAARIRSGRSSPSLKLPRKARLHHLRSRPPQAQGDQAEMALPMAGTDGPWIRTVTVCPTAGRWPRAWIRTTLTLTATVYPTLSTTPMAMECLTAQQGTAQERAAGMTGQAGEPPVGEPPAPVASKKEAVICSTAVGYSLHRRAFQQVSRSACKHATPFGLRPATCQHFSL